MGNVKSDVLIENDDLYKALVCTPLTILFSALAVNSIATSGILLMTIIFVCLAMYFLLSTLAYAAYYTNDYHENKKDVGNENLLKTWVYGPLAILFGLFTANSVMASELLLFKILFIVVTCYLAITALAYAAFYTNSKFDE